MCNKECEWYDGYCCFRTGNDCSYQENTNQNIIEGENNKMSLMSRILSKLDTKYIANEVYEKLQEQIEDKIVERIDEDDVVDMLVNTYEEDMIELFVEKGEEIVKDNLDVSEVIDDIESEVEGILTNDLF